MSSHQVPLLFFLTLVCGAANVLCGSNSNYAHCNVTVKAWAAKALEELEGRAGKEKLQLQDLLFFLHVPRTGGRTYFHCFLRKLYTESQECPRSYDKLRFDPSKPNCRLMVTHDDYSVMSRLPKESTSVVTILRNPVDRVFSTYEFSVEVAARFLAHPNLASSVHRNRHINSRSRVVSTLDIWPWKFLVPWMLEDLFARRKARQSGRMVIRTKVEDSYDLATMLMPLHEFIHQPLAHDIIHNGATFQVAGLANNSHLEEAQEIRQCVANYKDLGQDVLQVAKRRLDEMLYVGLTENHKESATMFVHMVGAQVLSQLQSLNESIDLGSYAIDDNIGSRSSFLGTGTEYTMQAESSAEGNKVNISPVIRNIKEKTFTVKKLMESYEECISTLWGSQSTHRISSLSGIAPANFSKEARSNVHEIVIKEIQRLNDLDVELYKHGQSIFSQQQRSLYQEQTSQLRQLSPQVLFFNGHLPTSFSTLSRSRQECHKNNSSTCYKQDVYKEEKKSDLSYKVVRLCCANPSVHQTGQRYGSYGPRECETSIK